MSTLFVCVSCREGGQRLFAALKEKVDGLDVVPVECLSNCGRGCSAAVTASGKWTYVVGRLDPDLHVEDIVRFARAHAAHAEGLPTWRERPEHVRKNTVARVPPLALPVT